MTNEGGERDPHNCPHDQQEDHQPPRNDEIAFSRSVGPEHGRKSTLTLKGILTLVRQTLLDTARERPDEKDEPDHARSAHSGQKNASSGGSSSVR
jgi:hypothetical protein